MDSTQEVLGVSYFGPVEGSPLIPPEAATLYFIIFFLLLTGAYFVLHQKKKPIHISHKIKLLLISALFIKVLLIVGGAALLAYWLVPTPNVLQTTPLQNESQYGVSEKIEIVFDRPISRRSLTKTISPEVPGIWIFENSLYTTHLYRRLVFYPTVTLKPNTAYTITLSNIKNSLKISPAYTYSFSFQTQDVPRISSLNPVSGADQVEIDSPIVVTLTKANEKLSQFDFEFTPSHTFAVNLNSSKTSYTLLPKEPLKQGTKYRLAIKKTDLIFNLPSNTIIKRGPTNNEYEGSFTTKEAPGIERFTPTQTNVLLDTPIAISFSQAMNKKSVEEHFSIEPNQTGTFQWINDKTVTFIPKQLAYDTTYTVKISQGARALGTGFTKQDIVKSFSTIGSVKVVSFYPANGWSAVGIDNSIKLNFDQEVDRESVGSKFSITPSMPGTIAWDGTTMIFKPSYSFAYNTLYTVSVASQVKSKYGLASKEQFSAIFTTQDQTVKLNVPFYLQEHALSCEIAALRMALAYKDIQLSEETLLEQVGIDNTPHNGNVWGNPYTAFVGNVDGKQMVDGYGVYWGPIARTARVYRNAHEFEGWDISQVADSISQGNPVIIWIYSKAGWPTSWNTPHGQSIFAVRDEHAVTIVGFVGPANNPSQVIVNDPLVGQVYWPRNLFNQKWNIFGRSGVVVY